MTRLSLLAAAAAGVVRRDVRLAMSYRVPFASALLSAFFSLTLFYYVSRLLQVSTFASADAYYAYVVVGLMTLQILNAALQTPPGALREELVAGTFERIVVSPFGAVGTVVSMLLFPFLNALVTAAAMVAFAGVVFGVSIEWATLPLALPLSVLAALSFAPFGLALVAVVLVTKQAVAGTTWIVAGVALISGLYFPTSLLPDWIRWASEVQPFTPAVELLRRVIVGTPLGDPAWLDVLKLGGFACVLMPVAILALERAIRVSKVRGTLIEY